MAGIKGARIEVNRATVQALLRSEEVMQNLLPRGERIAGAAGGREDFEVTATTNRDRVVVFVTTASHDARKAEAEDRALTRAIDAGR